MVTVAVAVVGHGSTAQARVGDGVSASDLDGNGTDDIAIEYELPWADSGLGSVWYVERGGAPDIAGTVSAKM